MGEPSQALSTRPLPTPSLSLPFPPSHRLTRIRRTLGPQASTAHSWPWVQLHSSTTDTRPHCDHPQPTLALPEPASVYGTEPQWKEGRVTPPFVPGSSLGQELGMRWSIRGAVANPGPHWLGASSSGPGERGPMCPHQPQGHSTFLITCWRGLPCCPAIPHVLDPLNVPLPHQANSALHDSPHLQVPPLLLEKQKQ